MLAPEPTLQAATPTATLEAQAPPTTAPTAAQASDCPLALPARLKVGMNARVTTPLNLRSEPAMGVNLVRTNSGTTQVQVIGGPVCAPYQSGAYLWWNIKLPDGTIGWSAEGSLDSNFYFLEPLP